METELKYIVDDEFKIDKIFSDNEIRNVADSDSEENTQMHAIYFDTDDRRLSREGIVYRNRQEGEGIMATLKWNGKSEEGMHKREEINVPLSKEQELSIPDLDVFRESETGPMVESLLADRKLMPIMDMVFVRRHMRLDTGKSISEISADIGVITYNGKKGVISELEIELFSGDEEDMRELGRKISEKYSLQEENRSKFKQGLML